MSGQRVCEKTCPSFDINFYVRLESRSSLPSDMLAAPGKPGFPSPVLKRHTSTCASCMQALISPSQEQTSFTEHEAQMQFITGCFRKWRELPILHVNLQNIKTCHVWFPFIHKRMFDLKQMRKAVFCATELLTFCLQRCDSIAGRPPCHSHRQPQSQEVVVDFV